MTQHDLARAANVPQPSIARIERGTVVPRAATLLALLESTGHRMTVEPIDAPVDQEAIRRRLAMSVPRRTREAVGAPGRKPRTGPVHILRRLRGSGVPFVLIGELAEVAHGAPLQLRTAVEVCIADTDVARERLALARAELGRQAAGLRIVTESAAGDEYETLDRNATAMPVDAGIMVRVAAIEDLVRVRRAGGSPDDQHAAATLLAILAHPLARLAQRP